MEKKVQNFMFWDTCHVFKSTIDKKEYFFIYSKTISNSSKILSQDFADQQDERRYFN